MLNRRKTFGQKASCPVCFEHVRCVTRRFRERAAAAVQARPKVKKNAALLSFEDDEGGEEDDNDNGGGATAAAARIRSAHEAIDDARYARQLGTLSLATGASWQRCHCNRRELVMPPVCISIDTPPCSANCNLGASRALQAVHVTQRGLTALMAVTKGRNARLQASFLPGSHQLGTQHARCLVCRLVKVNTDEEKRLAAQEAEETAARKAAVQVIARRHTSLHCCHRHPVATRHAATQQLLAGRSEWQGASCLMQGADWVCSLSNSAAVF